MARMRASPLVLIIEEQPLYRHALAALLQTNFPDAQVTSMDQAAAAVELLSAQTPDRLAASVVLTELALSDQPGLDLIAALHQHHPGLQLLVISGLDDPLRVGACLGAGASAFISKSAAPDRLAQLVGQALRQELRQPVWLTRQGPQDPAHLPRIRLTRRQLEVLGLVCQGLSNQQIAQQLNTVEATAKAHVSAILRELGVGSRTQAVLMAHRLGWKQPG
jgi:DNA-binding NarL/FixJ family response regulator